MLPYAFVPGVTYETATESRTDKRVERDFPDFLISSFKVNWMAAEEWKESSAKGRLKNRVRRASFNLHPKQRAKAPQGQP